MCVSVCMRARGEGGREGVKGEKEEGDGERERKKKRGRAHANKT